MGVFYFAWLAALGAFWPWFGLYLREQGFSETATMRLCGLVPAMGLVAPPLVGLLADARRLRPWLLRATTLAAAVAFVALSWAPARSAWLVAAVMGFALARAPVTSLADASAADLVRAGFGRIRLWGSLGFLVAALGVGRLLDRLGMEAMQGATVAALVLAAATAWAVPSPRVGRQPAALASWRTLLRSPASWRFLVAVMATTTATAAYDVGFSLHLQRLGHGRGYIGAAWALGVAAEVGVMAASQGLLARFGAGWLHAAAVATSALRWALISSVTAGWALLALQPLHGITFGLWYAAAVQIARRLGGAAPTAGQGLFAAAASAGSTAGMAVAGDLYARGGGSLLYAAAAVTAGLGAALAGWYAAREAPG